MVPGVRHGIQTERPSVVTAAILEVIAMPAHPQTRRARVSADAPSWAIVVAVAGGAMASSFGAAVLCVAHGWNDLFAWVIPVVAVGAVAWVRRGGDILDVTLPSFVVAYAVYVGVALERIPQRVPLEHANLYFRPLEKLTLEPRHWPVVLVAGILVAFLLVVVVALPVAQIPVRRRADPHAHDRLWEFVAQQNAARDREVR